MTSREARWEQKRAAARAGIPSQPPIQLPPPTGTFHVDFAAAERSLQHSLRGVAAQQAYIAAVPPPVARALPGGGPWRPPAPAAPDPLLGLPAPTARPPPPLQRDTLPPRGGGGNVDLSATGGVGGVGVGSVGSGRVLSREEAWEAKRRAAAAGAGGCSSAEGGGSGGGSRGSSRGSVNSGGLSGAGAAVLGYPPPAQHALAAQSGAWRGGGGNGGGGSGFAQQQPGPGGAWRGTGGYGDGGHYDPTPPQPLPTQPRQAGGRQAPGGASSFSFG
jgi:hypothetical protein